MNEPTTVVVRDKEGKVVQLLIPLYLKLNPTIDSRDDTFLITPPQLGLTTIIVLSYCLN